MSETTLIVFKNNKLCNGTFITVSQYNTSPVGSAGIVETKDNLPTGYLFQEVPS